jgi:ubiquinone/menaquinone biosynthesis C-methylase UbiE
VETPPLTPLAAAVLHVPAPERALVAGCGEGEPALFLAREFPAARIRAVDGSAERARAAQARVGLDPEGRLVFKHAHGGQLPFPDDHFDLVAQIDGRATVGELARVLRPGAHLIVAPTRAHRFAAAPRAWLLRERLGRAGFRLEREERAGAGNFLVARLGPPRPGQDAG